MWEEILEPLSPDIYFPRRISIQVLDGIDVKLKLLDSVSKTDLDPVTTYFLERKDISWCWKPYGYIRRG